MKNPVLLLITGIFACVIFTSYSNGIGTAGLNCTGVGGAQNSCTGSNCHDANSNSLTLSMVLVKLDGDTVKDGKYVANEVYTCRISGLILGTFPKFGFQFTSQRDNGIGGGNYLANSNPQLHTVVIAPYEIVEQNLPLTKSGNTAYVSFLFQAPAQGSGKLRLYTTMLAANGDAFASGDVTNNTSREFSPTPAAVKNLNESIKTKVFPNPVQNKMNFSITHAESGKYLLTLYNVHGQLVEKMEVVVNGNEFATSFNASSWASGNYLLHIEKDGAQRNMNIIKQ